MSSANTGSLSFQPWTCNASEEGSLKDILARVSLERGHFRNITESSLQEEIAAEDALLLSESESEEEDEGEGEHRAETSKPATREQLFKAKYEMLGSVKAAEQEILMSLDFVSLLLSTDAPRQAQNTISPALKEFVPLGTLGMDIWQRMPADAVREAQDELLANNVRLQALQHSADDLLAAASRLADSVRKETQYWEQVLSISEEGWHVCRMPGQQHRLGVSFGFSESALEFARRGIAALRAGLDGSITLEKGIGTKPKAIRAVLRNNGEIVGTSKLPAVVDAEETTLEARIRHARDSLFDEELYHEMIREGRTLTSLGVKMSGSAIDLDFGNASGSSTQLSLDLVSLDEDQGPVDSSSGDENELAHATVLAARLLLGQAHRDKLKTRSEIPPPMSETQKDSRPVMAILRPIMSFLMHRTAMDSLNAYMGVVASMLDAAKIQYSHQRASFDLAQTKDISDSEALINSLRESWSSHGKLTFFDSNESEVTFKLTAETTVERGLGSVFILNVPSRTISYRLDSLRDLTTAIDTLLASALAKALALAMDKEWRCNEREALLIRDGSAGRKSQSIWISVDSSKLVLSLNSVVKKMAWKVDAESPERGFWAAKDDML